MVIANAREVDALLQDQAGVFADASDIVQDRRDVCLVAIQEFGVGGDDPVFPLAKVFQGRLITRDLLDPIGHLDVAHADLLFRRSRLNGPGPMAMMSSSPPMSVRLCMKKSMFTCCSFGSASCPATGPLQ